MPQVEMTIKILKRKRHIRSTTIAAKRQSPSNWKLILFNIDSKEKLYTSYSSIPLYRRSFTREGGGERMGGTTQKMRGSIASAIFNEELCVPSEIFAERVLNISFFFPVLSYLHPLYPFPIVHHYYYDSYTTFPQQIKNKHYFQRHINTVIFQEQKKVLEYILHYRFLSKKKFHAPFRPLVYHRVSNQQKKEKKERRRRDLKI